MGFEWDELERMRPKTDWRIPLPPTCRKCGYNLSHLPEDRCPECGTPFTWREVRKRVAQTWSLTHRLRHANQDAVTGIICGLAGWFAIGLIRLVGWESLCVIDVIAGVLALFTIILGSQVLNLRRVPRWARPYIGDPPPSVLLGAAAMVLGFTLLIGVLLI